MGDIMKYKHKYFKLYNIEYNEESVVFRLC